MKLRKSKNKRIIKLANKFQPWDFGFNLEMEKVMFERMYEFFSSTAPVVAGAKRIAREIKLAINLLNIIMEEDTATVWVGEREWRLVKYVNTKNASRFAVKATACIVNGELKEIFKQPKTDDGTKNSLKGLIAVYEEDGKYVAVDGVSREEEMAGVLEPVFLNGTLIRDHTLSEIRERIDSTL